MRMMTFLSVECVGIVVRLLFPGITEKLQKTSSNSSYFDMSHLGSERDVTIVYNVYIYLCNLDWCIKSVAMHFIFNPRRACAERITVLGLCVCLCVCPSALFLYLAQLRLKQEILATSA